MADRLTDDERRLIDEAVCAGRVSVIPRGMSAYALPEYDEKTGKLISNLRWSGTATISGKKKRGPRKSQADGAVEVRVIEMARRGASAREIMLETKIRPPRLRSICSAAGITVSKAN